MEKIHVIHWRWGREEVEAGVLYRTGHETGGLDLEKRKEEAKVCSCHTCFRGQSTMVIILILLMMRKQRLGKWEDIL